MMATMSDETARMALQNTQLFADLSPELVERIASIAQRRHLSGNSVLWSRGECNDALVVLLKGRMKAVLISEDGREVTLHVFHPSEYLGEMSILDRGTHSATVTVSEPSDVLWIRGADFRKLMNEHPAIVRHLLEVQTERVRSLSDEVASHAFMSTCRRVARKLLQTTGGDQATLSHQEIAGLVGSTRESVTRALADLERRGMIRTGKQKITLLDRAALEGLLEEM